MNYSKHWIKSYKSALNEIEVGGKFEKQGFMAKAGLPVPPFFCLTTHVFNALLEKIKPQIQNILASIDWSLDHSIKEASRKIHELIINIEFEQDLNEYILSNFDSHFKLNDLVSVRSSMVASDKEFSEDSSKHAFAGMSESFLYVKRESILNKIKECFASGFSPQVMTYRNSQRIDLMDFSVAVGVQKMIFGDTSFVMFTCDPNTLERNTLIVAGRGIGEGVVQEKVETDHFFINRKTKSITSNVVKKISMLTLNSELGEGIKKVTVEDSIQSKPAIEDSELLNLEKLGQAIEKIFKCPQDIEGCFQNGEVFILQSRPIQFNERNVIVWTSANVSESFPGTTTPLTFSFAQDFYRIIFIDCYRALGVPEKVILNNMDSLDHMVGYLKGKIYYNLSSFYRLHSLSPLFPFFKKQWEDMMGFSSSFYLEDKKSYLDSISNFLYTLKGLVIISWRYLTNQRDVESFLTWWEEVFKPHRGRDFSELSSFECMNLYRAIWVEVGTKWWITLLNDTHLPTAYHVTEFLLKKWGKENASTLMSNLLCGGEHFKSVEIMYNGIRLSEYVKNDSELYQTFISNSPEEIHQLISSEAHFSNFKHLFYDHLYLFGDRGLQELKLEQKSLRENPTQLIQVIKNYLSQDLSVERILKEEKKLRLKGEEELNSLFKYSPVKKFILKFQFWKLRGYIRNRENTRYCRSELFGFSKRIFSRIGEHLHKSGIIERRDDIYFLHVDEIFGLIEGANISDGHKMLIQQRRKEFLEHEKIDLPMDITTNGAVFLNSLSKTQIKGDGSDLKGLGSSPGIVRGRARIVIDPTKVTSFGDSDILIAKETDPGWLFLMLSSKGMVVERGSMLSHTAITGRKFGIPTIVSVPGVTDKIKEGALIEIDGGAGTVTIIKENE